MQIFQKRFITDLQLRVYKLIDINIFACIKLGWTTSFYGNIKIEIITFICFLSDIFTKLCNYFYLFNVLSTAYDNWNY